MYLTTVYTQYTCGFFKISEDRRQLYDVCDTRPLPPYAKRAGTKTTLKFGHLPYKFLQMSLRQVPM